MKQKTFARIATSIILTLAMAISAGCSAQEGISPADGKDTAADDYFDFTDTIVEVEITDEDGNTVTTIISNNAAEPTEGSSDTSAEASTTSNGTNLPTVTSTQTTKPATTTSPSGNRPAVTTRPSTSPSTTTVHLCKYELVSAEPYVLNGWLSEIRVYACSCGSSYETDILLGRADDPSVTTSPEPVVTTTPQPPVTTTPAPVPGHTHSYTSKVTKEPTCTATGTRTYTCSCGDKYTESIPAKGHNWKTETIHHDAVIGTRDKTECWLTQTYIVWIALTQKGIDAGLGSKEYPNYHKVIAAIYHVKIDAPYAWDTIDYSTAEWLYLYSDETNSVVDAARDYGGDFLKKGYGDGTYNNTVDYEYDYIVVGTETYVITPAYDETVTTCTVCGAHK